MGEILLKKFLVFVSHLELQTQKFYVRDAVKAWRKDCHQLKSKTPGVLQENQA